MVVKPGTFTRLREKYGDHVDQIRLFSRPIPGQIDKYMYSAQCREHGLVCDWTKDTDERIISIRDHFKAHA